MRKSLLLLVLTAIVHSAYPQDFSNKGKEFWLCFPSHVPSAALAKMGLFITSDKNSSGTITVNGFSTSFTVTANQINGPIDIPYTDAHVNFNESGFVVNKGIHVQTDPGKPPVVVYSHIYAGFRSAASLILPVTTLGLKYYSANYTQTSTNNSKSQFQIIATDTNTTVRYQLRRNGTLDPIPTVVVLPNPGNLVQVQDDADLSGSLIESISTNGSGCKKIAVFSGSSALSIGSRNCNGSSFDPLYQQCYPVNTWGKNFGVIPLANNSNGFHVRVFAAENNTQINFNGTPVTLNAGEYYPAAGSSPYQTGLNITGDKPISVVQYLMSANCAGSNPLPGSQAQGDPDMIILNPVEQNINDITIFSSNLQNIRTKFLCVYMKTSWTSSFKINGVVPNGSFISFPGNPEYSYLIEDLTNNGNTFFRLKADSGFNAITYGMGDAESYFYSAGTNVIDLYQYVTVQNEFAIVNFPAGCRNTPIRFAMTFPYQPIQIKWVFGAELNAVGITDSTINNPVYDSSWVVNGRTLYRYKLNRASTISVAKTYPIKIIANNPTADGCSGVQEIEYDLQIFPNPLASFTQSHTGCLSDSIALTDNTDGQGRQVIKWNWEFGDGNTSSVKNPKHKYGVAGPYTIKLSAITDVGCLSDTAVLPVNISNPPLANFGTEPIVCEQSLISFTDSSVTGGSTLVKWTWNFGDGTPVVVNANGNPVTHNFSLADTFNISLQVETNSGCKSVVLSKPLIVNPKPVVAFGLPVAVCLPSGIAQFLDQSSIADGSEAQFTYSWDFGDGQISNVKNPINIYNSTGPFQIKLDVTSKDGCVNSRTQNLSSVYLQAKAIFDVTPEVCLGSPTSFTDRSNGNGSTVIRWRWEFGDGGVDTTRNPVHTYSIADTHLVRLFIYTDKGCVSDSAFNPTIVNPLPTVGFLFSDTSCATKDIRFTDTSKAAAGSLQKWNWSFGDGGVSTLQHPIHNYSTVNIYNVSLNVETSKGCKSPTISRPVKVNYLPNPNFGIPEICLSDPFALFTDSSSIQDNSESQFSYLWNFDDPNANAGNPNTSTLKNPQHRYTQTGTYDVKLTVSSKDGCTRDVTREFIVNGAIPQAALLVNNETSLCSNHDVSVVNKSIVDFGSIVKVEIYWDYLNDPTKKTVDDNPVSDKVYSYKYPDFGTPLTKTFQIRYVAYSGINCISQVTKTIILNASPSIQFNTLAGVCEEIDPFQVTAATEIFGLSGTGVFSGPGISPSGIFNPLGARPGLHSIRYTYNAANGCTSFKDQQITVFPTPIVDAGPDRTVLEGGFIIIDSKATGNSLSYSWAPDTAVENTRVLKPKVSPVEDIKYFITVTSGEGCIQTGDVQVTVLKEVKVPNAFSPNNDGINDSWQILYLESYPGCEVEVFNRYGQIVFRSVGYNRPWDGRLNGNVLPVGTYYWIINPKNGRKMISGSVTIIR